MAGGRFSRRPIQQLRDHVWHPKVRTRIFLSANDLRCFCCCAAALRDTKGIVYCQTGCAFLRGPGLRELGFRRYVAPAAAAVTGGATGGGAAACAFSRLQAVAAVSAPSTLRVPT